MGKVGGRPKREGTVAQWYKESACSAGDAGSIRGSGRAPEEGMATHSSTLAWRIPWTEEPGRLQSMRSQELDMT